MSLLTMSAASLIISIVETVIDVSIKLMFITSVRGDDYISYSR